MKKNQNNPLIPKLSSYRKKRYLQIVKKLGFEDLLHKLEKSTPFFVLMDLQYLQLEIVPRDFEIPPHTMREIEARFLHHIETRTISFSEFAGDFTIFECCILLQKFYYTIKYAFQPQTKVFQRCQKWLEIYISHATTSQIAGELARSVCGVLHQYCSLEHYLYGFKMEYVPVNPDNPSNITARFAVVRQKPPTKKIRIGKNIRIGIQLRTISILDKFQNQTVHWKGKIYDLYILGHALRRMEERLDINAAFSHILLALDVDYQMVREYRGKLLIPIFEPNDEIVYREPHKRNRLGYLIGTICDDVVLIRTFLFIAQDFTPEGDKLSQLLELKLIDKGYLNLDRLECFTRSNLRDDETLRPIFKACRLDHLFSVQDKPPLPEFSENAEFVREMLQLN